jgi:hypothetical protein
MQPPAWNTWLTHTLTLNWSKRKYACMKGCLQRIRDTCRICGEGSLVWLLGSSWRGHDNSGNTLSLRMGQILLYCLSFETWQLTKGEGGRERMDDYFCVAPSHQILMVKNGAKTLQVWLLLWYSVAMSERRCHQTRCYWGSK